MASPPTTAVCSNTASCSPPVDDVHLLTHHRAGDHHRTLHRRTPLRTLHHRTPHRDVDRLRTLHRRTPHRDVDRLPFPPGAAALTPVRPAGNVSPTTARMIPRIIPPGYYYITVLPRRTGGVIMMVRPRACVACNLFFVTKCSAHVVPPGDSEDQLACTLAGCQYRRCVGRGGGNGLVAFIPVVAILAVCGVVYCHLANKSKGAKFVQLDETTGAPSALVPQPPAAVAVSPEQAALRRQWFEGNWVVTWAGGKWCCASSSLCLRSATHNATSHNVRVGV
jgi:hypothetical protein